VREKQPAVTTDGGSSTALLIGAGADLTDLTRWVEVGQRRATGFR
jgi:hypothetical protein